MPTYLSTDPSAGVVKKYLSTDPNAGITKKASGNVNAGKVTASGNVEPSLASKTFNKLYEPLAKGDAKGHYSSAAQWKTGRPNYVPAGNDDILLSQTSPGAIAGLAAAPFGMNSLLARAVGVGLGAPQMAKGAEELSRGNIGSGLGNLTFGALSAGAPFIGKATPEVANVANKVVDPLEGVAREKATLYPKGMFTKPAGKSLPSAPEVKGLLGPAPSELPPIWYQGKAGVAEPRPYPIDVGTTSPMVQGKGIARTSDTLGAGEVVNLPPQMAAEYGPTFGVKKNPLDSVLPDLEYRPTRQDMPMANRERPDPSLLETYGDYKKQQSGTYSLGEQAPERIRRPQFTKQEEKVVSVASKVGEKFPEVKAVIGQYPEAIEKAATKLSPIGKIKQFANNMIGSRLYKELENDSPAGKEISTLLAKVSHTTRERAAAWDVAYDDIAKNLDATEMNEFWSAMDYGQPSKNAKVNEAVRVAREVDAQRTGLMTKMRLKNPETGEAVVARRDYAPRVYPPGFWEDPKQVYDALVTKFPNITPDIATDIALKKSSPELIDRIMKSAGVERKQAEAIARVGIDQSERKIASQFTRDLNLTGYRKDINVWKEHNWDIAKKTAEMEHYGTLDVADPNSPISKLIEQTTNPAYTNDLVKLQIGRVERDRFARQMERVNSFSSKVTSAMYLSNFAISNVSNLMTIPMQAGMKNFAKALTEVMVTNKGSSKAFASESGAMYNITKGILEHSSGGISKLFGINASENFNRTVSAVAGKLAAEDYFLTLKTGKLSDKYAKMLSEITLTPIEELAKQEKLTPQQIKFAGGRMSELTQGLAEARNVPVYASSPYMQLPWMFRKYAFQQTANMKDAILRDPVKNIPIWLAGSQIFGELVGDTKAGIKGGVTQLITGKSDIKEEIADRGSYLEGKLGTGKVMGVPITRIVDNMQVGFALGLLGDLYQASTSSKAQMASEFVGPALDTTFTGLDTATDALSGNPKPLGQELLRRVPFFGSGLQQGLLPTERQKKRLGIR